MCYYQTGHGTPPVIRTSRCSEQSTEVPNLDQTDSDGDGFGGALCRLEVGATIESTHAMGDGFPLGLGDVSDRFQIPDAEERHHAGMS